MVLLLEKVLDILDPSLDLLFYGLHRLVKFTANVITHRLFQSGDVFGNLEAAPQNEVVVVAITLVLPAHGIPLLREKTPGFRFDSEAGLGLTYQS